jgi:hypothetical protein
MQYDLCYFLQCLTRIVLSFQILLLLYRPLVGVTDVSLVLIVRQSASVVCNG